MTSATNQVGTGLLRTLLAGEPLALRASVEEWKLRRVAIYLGTIALGAGLYGAAMGAWRAPLQAVYVALKLPIILLLTSLANSLLNAMLAPLLGVNIGWRQSFLAILMSFTSAAAILGSFSPLIGFLVWNSPPLGSTQSGWVYSFILLTHVLVIAFAGVVGNLRLWQLLRQLSGSPAAALRVLLAWLAGNLLFGSELSWLLRPFIGSPALPVEFLRATAFKGNFFEAVYDSAMKILSSN